MELNNGGWDIVTSTEEDKIPLLMQLLLYWLVNLKEPVVPDEVLQMFGQGDLTFGDKVLLLGSEPFELINYLLDFFKQVSNLVNNRTHYSMAAN